MKAVPTPRTDRECDDYAGPLCWIGGTQFIPADFAHTLERELTEARATLLAREGELDSMSAALAAKDSEIKRLQEFELDVTCIGRDVHDYCQDLKADRTRRLPTLVLTMIGNLRARAEKAEAELAKIRATLQSGLDRDKDDTTTHHLAVIAINGLAERDQLRAEVDGWNRDFNDQQKTLRTTTGDLAKRISQNELLSRLLKSSRADAARLDGEITQLRAALAAAQQDTERLAKHIVRLPSHVKDHACAECVPGGESVIPGFQCAVHRAFAIDAARSKESDTAG